MNKFLSATLLGTILCASISVAHAETTAIDFTPNNFSMNVGQTRTVNLSGASVYYLNGNASPGVASAVLSGSFITITAFTVGTDRITVCTYGANNAVSCSAVNVTVVANPDTQTTQQTAHPTITFDKSQLNINVGESQTVHVTGSAIATGAGAYYVSDASSNAVSISVNSNVLTITGNEVGGENITVCQIGGACGNIYAFVPSTQANIKAGQTVSIYRKTNPGLSAFYMASNGASFLSPGSTFTIKFNTTQDITSSVLRVGTQSLQVNGTSSGPYSASYTMNGSETSPLPVSIDFWAADGTAGHTVFSITDTGMTQPVAKPSTSKTIFTKELKLGSTGAEVTQLQKLLKEMNLYSGPITGNFGPLTESALKKYQYNRNLAQVGFAGPATRAKLNLDYQTYFVPVLN